MNRRILYSLILALAAGILTACSGRKTIPESTLRNILRDAFISESVARHRNAPDQISYDSLDLHTPILERYGYTMEDFRYTIEQMASRKSNPLDNILAGVANDIKIASGAAGERFNQLRRLDSIAIARTANTVWSSDTVISGSLQGFRTSYSVSSGTDSLVPPGTYRLEFLYSTGSHARAYTKSVRYRRVNQSTLRGQENTLWIPVAKDTTLFSGELQVGPNIRRLDMTWYDAPRADTPPDTSYMTQLKLIFLLPASEAREELYRQQTGLYPTLDELYYERYIEGLKEAGITPRPDPGRGVDS